MKKRCNYGSLVILLCTAMACGGPPAENPLLEEARTNYSRAEQDSLIVSKAPVALREAGEALEMSEAMWEEGEEEMSRHYAYIARQKVAIAHETALLNAAQEEIGQAQFQRQQVLIEARRVEAERAEQRANDALAEARNERVQAEEARRRAEELSGRIDDLEAERTERGIVLTLGDMLFDFDQASLKSSGIQVVEKLSLFLQQYPERNVLIEGHTDSIGPEEYNQQLSLHRAESVRNALVSREIAAARIEIRGYGELYPIASNSNEAGREQNRRVEVVITNQQGDIVERAN